MTYADYVFTKMAAPTSSGIEPSEICPKLFPFQRDLVAFALRRGRAAIFASTGLGKSFIQAEWARHVPGRVIILTPLAVAEQMVDEAAKIGVETAYLRKDDPSRRIVVTNYEMLEHFDATQFAGVALDESSSIKAFDGAFRSQMIETFSRTPFRLACTATPAPNDHTELGNHSEFLGIKSRTEMLAEYFTHDGGDTSVWRLKGHAEQTFWRWVASWGPMVRMPSDLGYDDAGYVLPELRTHDHVIAADHSLAKGVGLLFMPEATTLADQRAVRRATRDERVALAAKLAAGDDPCIVWCELNDESDAVARAIPGAVEVRGSDGFDEKIDKLKRFSRGDARVMVTKPSIASQGLNWQHCSRMVFMGASHSFEQTFQAIRRCWRFGQKRPVDVHIIRAETESAIVENFRRKESDAERMALEIGSVVKDAVKASVLGASREWNDYSPRKRLIVPSWIGVDS